MPKWICLLRGINVGGNNILPMKSLKVILEDQGFENIQTYIQSGNVLFDSKSRSKKSLADTISKSIEKSTGFCPQILILKPAELQSAIENNPFAKLANIEKSVHLNFLECEPTSFDQELLEKLLAKTEHYAMKDRVFYFYAPDGIGRSKAAARIEKILGVPMTGRNWKTVTTLHQMLDAT